MKSTIKAIGWQLILCMLPLCLTLEGHEYGYFEFPNLVYPIYVPSEDQIHSPCIGWNSPFRLDLGHTEGNWYDVEIGYTTFSTFFAAAVGPEGRFVPFVDLRAHLFNNGKWASNIGGGLRAVVNNVGDIFGVNAYYDYRVTKRRQGLHQLGLGFEYLSSCVDIRWNLYLNVGKREDKIRVHVFDDFIGPFFAVCRDTRRVLSGGDLEIGSWLVPRAPCQFVNLYGAISPYYYSSSAKQRHNSSHPDGVYGITARLMTLLGDYFTLEVRAGYDRSYKAMGQATLTFELPLDQLFDWEWWCKDCCCCRPNCQVYQPVMRHDMIVLSPKTCCWEANF